MNAKVLLAVGVGGMLGAIMRYSITGLSPVYKDFPIGTLLVNSIASFLLGYLYG
ncbi:fluoride efflux transporter CrcB, partial [Thermococci archaeon]